MSANPRPVYELDANGQFVISNYNAAKPFSSFFPGIAGKMGIPMWVFYVNRGQCICSMGIQDKENPIMEFLPANWAYQLAPSQGFRTFIKFPEGASVKFYEPFQAHYRDREIVGTQSMHIAPSHLVLVEDNPALGLRFTVEYYSVPEERYAGLMRRLHITNTGIRDIAFEGLDGLPLIIPFGIGNFGLKNIRRLMEAFVEVRNYENQVPLFKAKVKPADRPDVELLEAGNFYLGFESRPQGASLLDPIVDPERIFGSHNDYSFPAFFVDTPAERLLDHQAFENRYPSAMSLFSKELKPGETYTVNSIIGHAPSQDFLNSIVPRVMEPLYFQHRSATSVKIIDDLTQKNLVVTANPILDRYVRQNFLDNVLRGGFPYTLKGQGAQSVLHLYSRKHGDLERDYNAYRITPSPYSQGNGNFRDINQNRRSDLLFNPDVGASNLEHFCNLIQLDGFNPLVLKEIRYVLKDMVAAETALSHYLEPEQVIAALSFLRQPVTPGELLLHLEEHGAEFAGNADALLGELLTTCTRINDSEFTEGYWSDHWTYNLDLLENYLSIYPEDLVSILLERQQFSFHDSAHRVLPRADKYVIWDGKPMQLDAVAHDDQKAALMAVRVRDRQLVHTDFGKGEVFFTTLFIKLLSVITNKVASLDPSGIGVEMETDKPNWYDALNGLPGLMGSSLSEALEIKRHAQFLMHFLETSDLTVDAVPVYEELHTFMKQVRELLGNPTDAITYWDAATSAKEAYREATRFGISGRQRPLELSWIAGFLNACVNRIDAGMAQAWNPDGTIPETYFWHQVVAYELLETVNAQGHNIPRTNQRGFTCFKVKSFKLVRLPLFLEGPVHFLRCRPTPELARQVASSILQSGLYDRKLSMYKVNAALTDQPMEIGRARVFSPGWFENESIWLHMEYKYLLELLRNGLYETFFDDFRKVVIPYLDPESYGRSILENSSFLVSTANPNPDLHGTGYVARLSGATAEFIHILMHMAMGPRPFVLSSSGALNFQLQPILPAWLFTQQEQTVTLTREGASEAVLIPAHSFSFMFLSDTLITYRNPGQRDTFGPAGVSPARWTLTRTSGESESHEGQFLDQATASAIRAKAYQRIEIVLE